MKRTTSEERLAQSGELCYSGGPTETGPWEIVLEKKRSQVTKDGNCEGCSSWRESLFSEFKAT